MSAATPELASAASGARRATASASVLAPGPHVPRSASKIAALANANANANASGQGKAKPRSRRAEAAVVVAALAFAAVAARHVWLHGVPSISPAKVHRAMDRAGVLGVVIWSGGFCLAELLHLPATVFIIAGVLRWGHFVGWILALIIAPLSCALSFVVVRRIGGQALVNVQWRFVQRMMARLERKPVATVAALRTFLFLMPSMNYALALSNVSLKNFIIGTAIGLVVPMSIVVLGIDHLIKFYGWSRADVVAGVVETTR